MSDDHVTIILRIEPPKDKTAVQRFFEIVNFVGQFIPSLSTNREALRALLQKVIAWHWDKCHQACMADLKSAFTKVPILSYLDPDELITVSVDLLQEGLGIFLLIGTQ